MADKGSTSAKGAGKAKRMKRGAKTPEQGEVTRPKQLRAEHPPVGEGGQGRGEESAQVQGLPSVPEDPQVAQAPDQDYQDEQQAPPLPHPGQEGHGTPVPQPPGQVDQQQAQVVPCPAPQPPIDQAPANAGQSPAFQASVGAFGGVTIRIQDRALAAGGLVAGAALGAAYIGSMVAGSAAGVVGAGLVAGVATAVTTLAAFYMDNKQKTEEAIRRAVERERHVQVQNIGKGSLLVRVKFLTLAGYWVIRSLNERIDQGSDRTCLQLLLEDELQRVGWTGPIQVGLEGWEFAEEEQEEEQGEEEAGTEQEERWEWAGMGEKQLVPPSTTTGGDSGLPEDLSSVAAMSVASSGEVEEGPFKWLRARLQQHKDSPTAQCWIKAYRSWEEGADILTNSGYTDMAGVKALVLGFMHRDMVPPDSASSILYGQSWLNLSKDQLKQLTTSQLQADPTDSTCLLLTALQLPYGDSRVQTLQQVADAVLQHGPGDWLYQHLHHIYCYLGWAIWEASPKPKPTMMSKLFYWSDQPTTNLSALAKALSTMASSLMYKQDHLNTVYITAVLSKEVSETEAIRQMEHFLSLAQKCDAYVPRAHYHLATLYGHQQNWQKVIDHFSEGEQRETNRLPWFPEVDKSTKDLAKRAYERAISLVSHK